MLLNPFNYHSPKTLKEACHLLSTLKNARVLAGGTFLINTLKSLKRKGLKTPDDIISLQRISEIKGIEIKTGAITIGAMTTLDDIIQNNDIKKNCPILKVVAENIASTQIRNMATIGGNVACRYGWAEFASCLIALEATLKFAKNNEIKEIPAEDFFKNNAKSEGLLISILISTQKNTAIIYERVAKTSGIDLPMLTICIKASVEKERISNVRFIINDGASFSKRDASIEKALEKSHLDEKIEEKILTSLDPEKYKLNTEYKKELLKVHSKYAIQKLLAQINDNT
ncbi:MAG: FAD binding domain-containing protein [Candidatus Omnitrophica bacterium]|nr:FAD binding domain-containing protein [Candidatus Omnitrophota bacterium]